MAELFTPDQLNFLFESIARHKQTIENKKSDCVKRFQGKLPNSKMSFIKDNMLGILVALVIVVIYFKIKQIYSYFKDRGVPYVVMTWQDFRSISISSFFLEYPQNVYKLMSDERGYVGMFQSFFMPMFLIMDPTLVESVLIKDFSHFQNQGIDINTEANPIVKSLVTMKGDEWRTMRHKLIPTFSSGKLRGMIPLMEECANSQIKQMKADARLRHDVKMNDFYNKYTMAAMANCVFGFDPESVQDPGCEFQYVVNRMVTPTLKDGLMFFLLFMLPSLACKLGVKIWPKEFENCALRLTKEAFRVRKESGVTKNDFVQLLLELKEKGSVEVEIRDLEHDEKDIIKEIQSEKPTHIEMTDELLSAQLFVFLVAGFQNITLLNTITTYELAKHPDIQQRVRDEVREMKNKYGEYSYEAVRDMKLLQACMDEAMRLHFPSMMLRKCTKEYTLPDGKIIEKGAVVLIPSKALHSDPKYWPKPNEFYPDFFLDRKNIRPGTYMPFGEGPRICIGMRMAQMMVKVILAKLLDNFEFIPSDKTKEPVTLGISQSGDFDGGSWCTFKPLK